MPSWRRDLRIVQVHGPDAHHFLNVMLTQQLADLELPAAREWLWLEAKGPIIASGTVVLTDDATALLIVDNELAEVVAQRLLRFRFSLKAEITIQDDLGVYSEPLTDEPDGDQYPNENPYPQLTKRDEGWAIDYPYGYRDIIAPLSTITTLPLVEGWDDWRVSAGVPVWGKEIITGTRTQELGLLPTHGHMKKGCYPGQESIAKIYNLGEVRRALCLLATPEPVSVGQIISEQKRPAPITSANQTHALAMISLKDGKPPAVVEVDGQSLRVIRMIGSTWPIPGGWRKAS